MAEPPTELIEAREQHELATLTHETAMLQAETDLMTGMVRGPYAEGKLVEAWGEIVPRSDYPENDFRDSWQSVGQGGADDGGSPRRSCPWSESAGLSQ